MIRKLTNRKKRERREANHKAIMAILDRGKELLPASYLICHQPGRGDKPASGSLSFSSVGSRARNLFPVGVSFTDARGIKYNPRGDGSFEVLNKPRSRVKRLREARL